MFSIIKTIAQHNNEDIQQITLENAFVRVRILTYGATIQSLHLKGYHHSLVLGANQFAPYQDQAKYFGAVVGRVANRIAKGQFALEGKEFQLPLTAPEPNQLHGGPLGTGARNWTVVSATLEEVHLQLRLADGEMGYPGNMTVELIYRLVDAALDMEIKATSDKTTLCNFAGHSYFNLDGTGSILDHQLEIQAESYLPVDEHLIPTGEIKTVDGTAYDFRALRQIGQDDYPSLDTNFCLADHNRELTAVATLVAPKTGLRLTYETTETGLQVYDGRHIHLPAELNINHGDLHAYSGIALEAQAWPDAVHHKNFPSTILKPGQIYHQRTRYQFD